jgi:hypothetical protein
VGDLVLKRAADIVEFDLVRLDPSDRLLTMVVGVQRVEGLVRLEHFDGVAEVAAEAVLDVEDVDALLGGRVTL